MMIIKTQQRNGADNYLKTISLSTAQLRASIVPNSDVLSKRGPTTRGPHQSSFASCARTVCKQEATRRRATEILGYFGPNLSAQHVTVCSESFFFGLFLIAAGAR